MTPKVIAIDPGTDQSAMVMWDGAQVWQHAIVENEAMLDWLRAPDFPPGSVLVVEDIQSYGMAVGVEVFRTVRWSGRFEQVWLPRPCHFIGRRAVKIHLCQSMRATDSNIWQALVDRFGPSKAKAVGTVKEPGPLFGVKSHERAALALAITYFDQQGAPL